MLDIKTLPKQMMMHPNMNKKDGLQALIDSIQSILYSLSGNLLTGGFYGEGEITCQIQ